MPHHQTIPDSYRLLAVFSGQPLFTIPALERAGLRVAVTDRADLNDPGRAPLTDAHRSLLRDLAERRGWIRWVKWGGEGYVLTGLGEYALDDYRQRYGPVQVPSVGLGQLARQRLADQRLEQEQAAR